MAASFDLQLFDLTICQVFWTNLPDAKSRGMWTIHAVVINSDSPTARFFTMPISIDSETLLSFPEAARRYPGRPHVSTIFRWAQRGVRGVTLETILCGGRRFTSSEALQRFAEAVTAAANKPQSDVDVSTLRAHKTRVHHAEREADRAGL